MAICLRRVFMNSGCVLLMARRNRQADYLCHKLLHSWLPTIGETAKVDLTLKARTCVSGIPLVSIGRNGTCQFCTTPKYSFDNFGNINTTHPGQGTLLFCAKESKAYKEDNQPKEIKPLGKAEPEQVMHILNVLSEELPKIFVRYLDYSIFHRDLILENNIKGTRKIGIHHLIKQVTLLRTVAHIKYAKVIFEILKITGHPEDGTVRVRWRIRGLPNYKALFSFMKHVTGSKISELDGWYDAFSIFYVYSDGLVHKLTVDKMIPDEQEKISSYKNKLAAKIGLALGVMMEDFSVQMTALHDGSLAKQVPFCRFKCVNNTNCLCGHPSTDLEHCISKCCLSK